MRGRGHKRETEDDNMQKSECRRWSVNEKGRDGGSEREGERAMKASICWRAASGIVKERRPLGSACMYVYTVMK